MVKVEQNFKAPLNRKDFAAALKKGLGRALLHVKDHGLKNIEDLVLDACLHDQAYDPESQSSRAEWLLEMINNRQEFPKFRDNILNALKIERDRWDLQQLLSIAKLMAEKGDNDAHQLLRMRIFEIAGKPAEDDMLGAEELIELEGVDGLLELARIYGQRLLNNPKDVVYDFSLNYGGVKKKEVFTKTLFQYAKHEPQIKTYWDYLQRTGVLEPPTAKKIDRESSYQQWIKRLQQKFTLEQTIDDARNGIGEIFTHYMHFGRCATAEELEEVYSHFLTEKKESVQLRLLWVFRVAAMPQLENRVFELATGKNEALREASIAALAQISDKQVHNLARQKVERGELLGSDSGVLDLFIRNYKEGDAHLIAQALHKIKPDEDEAHSLGSSILDLTDKYDLNSRFPLRRIYMEKHYDDPGLAKPLIWVYENTPCMYCRHKCIVNLDKLKQLEDSIIYECLFDADEEIRAFAQKLSG